MVTTMSVQDELFAEITATREAFHSLLGKVPVETYSLLSDNPDWTVSEVLYHMSVAPRMLGTDVKMIMRQSWLLRLIPSIVPKQLFDWLNKQLTRYGARNSTPESLAEAYDQAHQATLKALTELSEEDFARQVDYPDWDPLLSGEVNIERLFHYVKVHFDSHAERLMEIVEAQNHSLGNE